jgi:hypothetical protein
MSMIAVTLLASALAAPAEAGSHSAAFERFLDARDAARDTPMCLMPLVEELHARMPEMSVAERAEVASFLGPAADPGSLPLRTPGVSWNDAAPPPSTGAARTTCIALAEKYGANQLVGDHFTIAWDDGATESRAQDLMEAFDKSYAREIGELGWKDPTGMDAFNLWVYIAKDDSYAGAYTYFASCPSRGYMPFIVVYSGSFFDGSWYKDCAAHEFNHASQEAYGLSQTYDLWWWEATATWMEEYVYSHNSWSEMTFGFATSPQIGMQASGQSEMDVFWHMYGMNVWAFYLDQYVGGMDLVRGTWEYLLNHSPSVATMPEVLADMGIDFDQTYEGFLAASAVMDFDDHDWFYPVTLTQDMTELPHTGTPNGSLPQGLGQNFFRIDRATNPEGKDLQVTFTSDEDVDWYVVLTTTSGSGTVSDHVAATKDSKTGAWIAQLPWDGENDAYMTVSPNTESLTHEYEYEYTVALLDPPAPVDTGDTGIGATSETPSEKHEKSGICASAGGPSSLLLAALSLLAARRRRVTSRSA